MNEQIEKIKGHIEKTERLARQERENSPEIIQRTKAVRHEGGGSPLRLAYCKTDAPAQRYIEAYLDEDGSGEIVFVYCSITPQGFNLNEALPRLTDGQEIIVAKIYDPVADKEQWKIPGLVFQASKDCGCYGT
jgi:hypothetical protein